MHKASCVPEVLQGRSCCVYWLSDMSHTKVAVYAVARGGTICQLPVTITMIDFPYAIAGYGPFWIKSLTNYLHCIGGPAEWGCYTNTTHYPASQRINIRSGFSWFAWGSIIINDVSHLWPDFTGRRQGRQEMAGASGYGGMEVTWALAANSLYHFER